MAAASAAALCVAVVRCRRDAGGLLFCLLTLAFGLWALGRGAVGLDLRAGPGMQVSGALLVGLLAPACAREFAGGRRTTPIWALAPVLCAGALMIGPERASVIAASAGFGLAGALYGAWQLARASAAVSDPASPGNTRLRYLAVSHWTAVCVAGAAGAAAWFEVGGATLQSAALLVPLAYLYTGYLHLARVPLQDLRQLMGNTVALAVLALALAGSFAGLWLWVGPRLEMFFFNAFVASFVLLVFLEPIRQVIQRFVDGHFVAGRLALERAFAPLRDELGHMVTLDECLRQVLVAVDGIERLRASAIFLLEDPHVGFQQVGSVGLPPRRRLNLIRDPAWVSALETGGAVSKERLEKQRAEAPEDERDELAVQLRVMDELGAQLALPLRGSAALVGFWTLSDERAEEPFSNTEVKLLLAIAGELGAAIENTRTFERVRARDRLVHLGEMAGGLAHEIRNPLAAIRGAIALLDGSTSDGGAGGGDAELQRVIVEEIARLDEVVEGFLDYARPSEHSTPLREIGAFVESCARTAAKPFVCSRVELEIEVDADLPPVRANPQQLERAIGNVVQNAYQALGDRGRVRVRTACARDNERGDADRWVEITITDDGPGMDEETLARACIPFFTTRDAGTGLGLALCERLVRNQGGHLRLRSQPGVGTEVKIRLSQLDAEEAEAIPGDATETGAESTTEGSA